MQEEQLQKLADKMKAYRAEANQAVKDLGHVVTEHASLYAARRKAELEKKLSEIDAQ
jgi:hypothetical protein